MHSLLQAFSSRRVAVNVLLGFSSAVPLALTAGTLQAWMATEKVDIKTIGLFSLVGLPYTWKFLWSFFFDRFTTKFLGPRRGWILVLQLCLVAGLIVMGSIDPVTDPVIMAAMALVVVVMSASQDIVIDAYRTEVLRPEERGPGATAVSLGLRLGLLFSGALALILADQFPWCIVYYLMAGGLLFGIIGTLIGPEPSLPIVHPHSLREAVINPFLDFFRRKGAWAMLGFVIFYKFGDAFSVALMTPFLIQVGFTKTTIGAVFKGVGLLATLVGSIAGGIIINRIGIARSLWIFGVLQALSNFGFMALVYHGAQVPLLIGVITVDNLCGGLGNVAFIAFMMALCNVQFTATQYALLTSVMSIARTTVGAPAGFVVSSFGWPLFFVISVIMAIPGLALLRVFAPWGRKNHELNPSQTIPAVL